MKIKHLLTKTLLVAAGLLVGQSVWAEDAYTTVYSRATVGSWTESDLADWGGNSNLTIDATYGLFFNPTKPSAPYSASKSFSIKENSKIKYVVSWRVGSSTGRDSNYEYIQFGDKIRISWNSNYYFYLDKTGTSTMTQQIGSKGSNTVYTKNITIIFDTSTKTVESFNFDGIDLTSQVTGALTGNFNSLTFGLQRGGGTSNWGYPNGIITINVSECEQAVTNADYTINYKIGENLVKSVAGTGVVGQEITADVAVDGTETGYKNHYLITAAEAPSMTLVAAAASNVLNVPVRAPYTATLKVTTTIGTNEPALVETPLTETDAKVHTWSYAYPMYVLDGGKYYKADNITTFGEGGEFTNGQVIEKSVTYSTVDEDVVFFREAEASAGTNYTYSNGGNGNVGAQNARDRGFSVGTLPAGMYQFIVNITAANRRSLGIRQSTNDHLASVGTSNEDMTTGIKSAIFALDAETANLYINGANSGDSKTNQSEDFDYVLIKKVPATVTVDIKADGSTFSSAYPIDCDKLPAGVKAYKVTKMTASEVTASEVTGQVAANTGLILKADAAGKYDIPVVASGVAVEGNMLKAAVTATPVAADEAYGLKDGKFHKLNAGTIPAGKAYLLASSITSAPELSIVFGGATGISEIKTMRNAENEIFFDLQGRKVAQPAKGLYIQNGRKVILK